MLTSAATTRPTPHLKLLQQLSNHSNCNRVHRGNRLCSHDYRPQDHVHTRLHIVLDNKAIYLLYFDACRSIHTDGK